jgi:hypothetical protein
MLFSSRLVYTILFYLLIIIALFITKPKLLFDDNNQIKSFGFRDNETLYSIGVISTILAILSYYIFTIIDYIFMK